MKKFLIVLFALGCFTSSYSQFKCDNTLKQDSIIMNTAPKKDAVEALEVKIKNNYKVQFIRFEQKNYLRLEVKDNLGYGQTGSLLLLSGSKQFYVRTTTLKVIDPNTAFFLIELNPQYLQTIKDYGLTSVIFNEKSEFSIPKTDSETIKKAAACFFDIVIPK